MLELEEARALITTSLTDEDLEAAIRREEAWLARRIGPLEGLRTDTFVTADGDEVLRLRRPTDLADVQDSHGDRSLSIRIAGWSDLVLLPGAVSWSGDVSATYEPSDGEEVKRVLLTCLRLSLGESAYTGQSAGGYSASVSVPEQQRARYAAWKSLTRPAQPTTIRVQSAIPFGGKTVGEVAIAPVGS